jgi:hypothetical protein
MTTQHASASPLKKVFNKNTESQNSQRSGLLQISHIVEDLQA